MKRLSRRSATVGMIAAVTAIPAIGLAIANERAPGDDKLLAAIRRYRSEIAAINASGDLSDEETDAWVNRADEMLVDAAGHPVLTAASALAVLDLLLDENEIGGHSIYGEQFVALAKSARDYFASTV